VQAKLRARVLLAGASVAACGGLLGIDEPPLDSSARAAGNAGNAGTAGVGPPRGGTAGLAGSASAEGGAGDASGGSPPEPAGGGPSLGGASGSAGVHDDAGNGSSDGGTSGGSGTSGAGSGPRLGGECDGSRDRACAENNVQLVLRCEGGVWEVETTCLGDAQCAVALGECRSIDWRCRYREPVCTGAFTLLDCDADLIDPPVVSCPFGCESGACFPGSGDDLIVHPETLERPHTGVTYWANPIEVCVHDRSEHHALYDVVRDEAERSWGRYLDVDFTSWAECSGPVGAPRVELDLVDDCASRLVAPVALGAPSTAEARRVTLCRTYRTAGGALVELASDDALLRFVTRHVFGHVLGWEDSRSEDAPSAMVQGLAASSAPALGLDGRLLGRYEPVVTPGKPRGSLVTTRGACLSRVGGELVALPCSDPQSGRFELTAAGAALLGEAPPVCLSRNGGGVAFDACDGVPADARFELTRARWSTPDRCVAPYEIENGSAVALSDCGDIGDVSQAWRFELQTDAGTGDTNVRLRFESLGACLTRATDAGFLDDVPTLDACDDGDSRQLFALYAGGRIGLPSGLCLRANRPDGALHLYPCASADAFWLSGALHTTDGHGITAGDGSFVAEPLGSVPGDGQIFDFAF
jgi:hypothetical protein